MKEVFICSAVRTPLGSFGGMFTNLSATDLGASAIKGALHRARVAPDQVQEVFMGNVVSANLGQAPARQAALKAGISESVPCTTVNKVCASGMKTVMLGTQMIQLGLLDIVVAGGMESMSNIPYYLPNARFGYKYGNNTLVDGLQKDGLTDASLQKAMGVCADNTAVEMNITREEQDEFAVNSYKAVAENTNNGNFNNEIIPVEVPQRKKDPILITEDEEFKRVNFDKIPNLRPAFTKDGTGTVTAANASTLNDGASALVLASAKKVKELGLTPLAKIISYADAATDPLHFTTAPTLAAPLALKRAGLELKDVDYLEVNEAFAVVPLAFSKKLGIDPTKMNAYGGAVAMGHPLGASGARILATLNNVLTQKNGSIGLAAVCNGGGGASALVMEKV